jgi:uncharacterized protein with PIN domain
MNATDYWIETIATCAEENNIPLTKEQITVLAESAQGSHDNYGMAFYSPPASENPVYRELEETKAALKREQEAESCPECKGRGRLYSQGPHHGSDSQCWKCHGKGKIYHH